MGEPVVALFIIAAAFGIAATGLGLARRNMRLVLMGGTVMAATLGAWFFGPLGAAVGVIALVLLRIRERRFRRGGKVEKQK